MEAKYIVGLFIGILVLSIGGYQTVANITDDSIEITLPSENCPDSKIIVTKDDFRIKCGWRVLFKADTTTEYYKTYGTDEWVKNNRYVGRNKDSIMLELVDKGDSFDIIRTTRYRKGSQYVRDGTLKETYSYDGDKVKITYNYTVNNKALHKICMRVEKQYKSYLDAFDPEGYTGIYQNGMLCYEGYGNLFIDPTITLISPSTGNATYNEGATVPLVCNTTSSAAANITLLWNANGTWMTNGTETVSGPAQVTFSRIIPHQNDSGTITWNCEVCNSTSDCTRNATNFTLNPMYSPNTFNILLDSIDYNLLNGSDWDFEGIYPRIHNITNQTMVLNWTHPRHPDGDNVTWNVSYYGRSNTTRNYAVTYLSFSADNGSTVAKINISQLGMDDWFFTVEACSQDNSSLCVNDTISYPIEVFDFVPSLSRGNTIRFNPAANVTKEAALGQTSAEGIIKLDWDGYSYPDGIVNVTLNYTQIDSCAVLMADDDNNLSSAVALTNNTKITVIENSTSDPDYIWLWINKSNCGTTAQDFVIGVEVLN
jgi:hypothetical protein